MTSLICEEFHCLPSQAMNEPQAEVLDILELRYYQRTKQAVDRAQNEEQMPAGPMAELVKQIEEEQILAFMAARKPKEKSSSG